MDGEVPTGTEEIREVRQYAYKYISLWRKRTLYSTLALLLSCASVYLFSDGHPLHRRWEDIGKYLVLVSMGLLLLFVYCAGSWYSAWQALRDVEKEQP
jgi:hypothetical protein